MSFQYAHVLLLSGVVLSDVFKLAASLDSHPPSQQDGINIFL